MEESRVIERFKGTFVVLFYVGALGLILGLIYYNEVVIDPPSYKELQQIAKQERIDYLEERMEEGYSVRIGDAEVDVLPPSIMNYELAESSKNKIIYLLD